MISVATQARGMVFCLTLLFLIFGSCSSSIAQTDLSRKKVLILHSFGYAQTAYKIIDASLQEAFVTSGLDFNNLYFEFLDLARNPTPEYRHQLAEIFRNKFKGRKLDLVLALHQEALQFLLQEGKDVYPEGPIISVLGDPTFSEHSDLKRPLIHLPFIVDVISTAREIFNLQPNTRKIFVIAGSSALDRRFEDLVVARLKAWKQELDVESIPPLPLAEILKKVANLPSGTAILYTTVYADSTGKTYMPADAARMICATANAPVFGLFETLLGNSGVVGGTILNHRVEGQRAVRIAMDILQGNLPTEPITILPAPLTPTFDWQQLKRWGFGESALSEGSIVLNRPETIWSEYQGFVIGGVSVFLVQAMLVIGLLIQRNLKRKAKLSLWKKTEELDQFFNVSLDLLCIATTDGYFLRVNKAMERILGHTRQELMSRPFLDFVHPDDLDRTRKAISSLASQEKVFSFENRYRCKDGTYRWLQWSSAPTGNLIYAAARDVTEQKLIESETRRLKEDMAHVTRVSTLGELTSTLAHEINQPLAAILSNTQAAQRYLSQDKPDMHEIGEILQDIVRDNNRAAGVIRKVQSMLKKEAIRYESLSLNDVIEEILAVICSDGTLAAVSIEREFDTSLPAIWGDRIQLQQVVMNLVLNAAYAMGGKDPDLRRLILRTSRQDDRFAQVSVRDFGPGIQKDVMNRIFDSFFTTKSGGLGMGLAISKDIVKSHNGEIRAVNNPDTGVTVSFTVPFESGVMP